MSDRLFDKAEADALLPRLRELLRHLQEIAGSESVTEARHRLAGVGRSNGSAHAAAELFQSTSGIQAVLAEVEEAGVILRDAAIGLCDFPAVHDGEEIYLCWKLGEDEVGWWHPRDTGIAGRQPL